MRGRIQLRLLQWRSFRIPMRGYEMNDDVAAFVTLLVPNPHEGL